jgi:GPI-anchor transamidase subunit S
LLFFVFVSANDLLVFNTLYYISIFVLIGVPIWLMTTTTYRATLPFDEINEISNLNFIKLRTKFEIVQSSTFINKDDLLFELSQESPNEMTNLNINYDITVRGMNQKEKELIKNSLKLEDFDDQTGEVDSNTLKIFILNEETLKKYEITSLNSFILLNNLYLKPNDCKDLSLISKFLKQNYLKVNHLKKKVKSHLNGNDRILSKNKEKDSKTFNFDSHYELTFSLINSKPEKIDSNWNIEQAIEDNFNPIIKQLSSYSNYSLKSQVLLYSDFDSHPVSSLKDYYFIKSTDLNVMTNSLEKRLGSRISDGSAFEFVIYIPTKQPLFILRDNLDGVIEESKVNAFLVPRWGGIYIDNPIGTNIDASVAVKYFLTQFLELIGVELNDVMVLKF